MTYRFLIFLFMSNAVAMAGPGDFLVHGCWQIKSPAQCYYRPGSTLRFWSKDREHLTVFADEASIQRTGLGYSTRYHPKTSQEVIPFNSKKDALTLIAANQASWLESLARALKAGQLQQAKAILQQTLAQNPDEAEAYSRLARLALAEQDIPGAKQYLTRAAQLYQKVGNNSGYVNDITVLIYLSLYHDGRATSDDTQVAAVQLLGQLDGVNTLAAKTQFLLAYYTGIVHRYQGYYQIGQQHLQQAIRVANDFDFKREEGMAQEALANLLTDVGKFQQAETLYQALLSSTEDACARAYYANSAAGSGLLEAESLGANDALLSTISVHLTSAAANNSSSCNDYQSLQVFIDLNEALLAILGQQEQVARRELEPIAETNDLPPLVKTWKLDFRGRIAALTGDWVKAEKAFTQLKEWGASEADKEAQWRATLGLARVQLANNQSKRAVELLRENDERAHSAAQTIGIHEERSRFFSLKQQNSQLLLATLLEQKDARATLDFLRNSRKRVLGEALRQFRIDNRSALKRLQVKRYVNVRAASTSASDWMLSEQEFQQKKRQDAAVKADLVSQLAQLEGDASLLGVFGAGTVTPNTVLNMYFHQDRGNTVVVAESANQITMQQFNRVSTDHVYQLGHLLTPFLRQLDNAQHLNLYPSGEFANTPLHRVQYRNGALGEQKSVLYRLDLVDSMPDFSWPHQGMLLLGDSRNDLPQSRKEVLSLAKHSNERGTVLLGQTVSYGAVREQLANHQHVHYSGHGHAEGQSWHSSLALNGNDNFTIGDILTLANVPDSLILSACSTGSVQVESLVDDWNVVNAFLIAGSQWVIGSPEPVADEDALQFMRALYRLWKAEDNLLVAWQKTQHLLASKSNGNTWQHFRLYAK